MICDICAKNKDTRLMHNIKQVQIKTEIKGTKI